MAISLTRQALLKSQQANINPQLVLSIQGLNTKFGIVEILKYIRYGDPGLVYGGGEVYGGYNAVDDQFSAISFDGSSSSIQQQLNPDKGQGSSVSSMQIALVDFDGRITELISPGFVLEDVLGRKASVFLGFDDTAFPEDYIRIFRGIIDEISSGAGKILLNIASPDQKKRQDIYLKADTKLTSSISDSVTTIDVEDTTNFLEAILGPDGMFDPSFKSYIRIDNEIIEYTSRTPTSFTGCIRGRLGTLQVAHDDEAQVDSFYRLTGNALDLSLKFMLSGTNDYWVSDLEVDRYVQIDVANTVPNSVFFNNIDLSDEYGVVVGDYITISGAINGANNFTLKPISQVIKIDTGSYVVVDDVSIVPEMMSTAIASFRSQYDTLADGLQMSPDEVDIDEHLRLKRLFLSSFSYDFYLKDDVDAKEFIEKQFYFPAAMYSIPRKARSSVGYHIGPIPSVSTKSLTDENVVNASKISLKRSIGKNFFNAVVYKFDVAVLEEKFLKGVITFDATSQTRIPVGTKALIVEANGLRSTLGGEALANSATQRRLDRYKYGAEYIDQMEVQYGEFFNTEIGDILFVDNTNLQISNTETGIRGGGIKFYEVVNKSLDIKTGKVRLSIVDTGFDEAARYCLISPSSRIKFGVSQTEFVIYNRYASYFGIDEYRKWSRYKGLNIRVRSDDFTTRNATAEVSEIVGNTIKLLTPLGFTPLFDDTMTLNHYNWATEQLKFLYGFMRNTGPFDDGKDLYQML